jgi:hypothetical protein
MMYQIARTEAEKRGATVTIEEVRDELIRRSPELAPCCRATMLFYVTNADTAAGYYNGMQRMCTNHRGR